MEEQNKKPMSCSECEHLKEGENPMCVACDKTGEKLNPYELFYSTGIGNKCPYYQ